jgi:mannosyltransferase
LSVQLLDRPRTLPDEPLTRDRPGVRRLALGCGLLTTAIGFVGLGRPSLWYDEAASLSGADRPLDALPALLRHVDLVHGLYYVLLHSWVQVFGTSAVALRSLSAIALGVACAGCVVVAHRLGDRSVALVAGIAFALLPGLAWSATEAREWSLATAAVTWATAALLRALETDQRRSWVGYALLAVVAIALSVMTVLMAVPHLWLAWRAGRLRPAAITGTGVLVLTLPLISAASTQREQIAWIALTPRQVVSRALLNQLFVADQSLPSDRARAAGLVLAVLFLLVGLTALAGRSRGAWLGVLWLGVPTVLLAAPVVAGVHIYQDRYLTFAAPGAVLLFAQGLVDVGRWTAGRVGFRALLALGLLTACAASATVLVSQRAPAAKSGDDYRTLASAARGTDQVLYERPDARGIRLAYPGDFVGVADVLLTGDPTTSRTLWGAERGADSLQPHGEVVAYVFAQQPRDGRVWLVSYLQDQGCVLQDNYAATRWVALRYSCP